jgi:ribonuclease P protein component
LRQPGASVSKDRFSEWPLERTRERTVERRLERLKRRADFLAAATGAKAHATAFVLQARQRPGPDSQADRVRVGFTASKKVGNAVERNRVRRRLREVVRLSNSALLQPGHDYVLVARRATLEWPFERLMREFDRAVRRVHAPPRPDIGQSRHGPKNW